MSKQTDMLSEAIKTDIDTAIKMYPNAITNEEYLALKKLSRQDLQKLLEVRQAAESAGVVTAADGIGILSF